MSWFERKYCFSFHLFWFWWKSHIDNSKSTSLDFSYETSVCCERSKDEEFRNFNECVFTPWVSGSGPEWKSWDDLIFNHEYIHFVKQGKTKTTNISSLSSTCKQFLLFMNLRLKQICVQSQTVWDSIKTPWDLDLVENILFLINSSG